MLDVLGCPINVGDKVLTTGYSSSTVNHIAVVEKVNPKSIVVTVKAYKREWVKQNNKYISNHIEYDKKVKRKDYQVVVINKQLEYIQEYFPENLI